MAEFDKSLSARRAWIEIRHDIRPATGRPVALRKESVDRNNILLHYTTKNTHVALRKESVDRNIKILVKSHGNNRRSPQGERG